MKELERKIEEAAENNVAPPDNYWIPDREERIAISAFKKGAKSDEAKAYWQEGMYTEGEVKEMLNSLFFTEIYPDYTIKWEQEDLDLWFEQNKKK